MNGFMEQYNRARAFAERGLGVVLLPVVFEDEAHIITWIWGVDRQHVDQALSPYGGVRAGYLIDTSIKARKHLAENYGIAAAS
jgi:hypothetical protein